MWLFVGLGNPGAQYSNNRHNIGFMAADEIVRRHGFSSWRKKYKSEMSEGELEDQKVMVIKPQTFMNDSGEAVRAAAAFHKILPDHIVVFYDELDLVPRKVRVKKGGGAGGHNGIRSVDQHMGPNYWRVRLGIGHPGDRNRVTSYVLGNFSKEEIEGRDALLDSVAVHTARIITGDPDGFMSKVAADLLPPKKEKEVKEVKKEKD